MCLRQPDMKRKHTRLGTKTNQNTDTGRIKQILIIIRHGQVIKLRQLQSTQ